VVAVDPYLTNSCKDGAAALGLDVDRLFPPPIQPEDLDVDVIAFTHTHQDHCDQATITAYRKAGRGGPYVAPGETMEKLLSLGITPDEILLIWPNKEYRFGDVRLKATYAVPYWADDLTHVGYLVLIDNGPTIYLTGDTDYHDLLGYIADHKPDIMVAVINGAFRNLGPNEVTKLAARINPKVVIPCHYDLFRDNSLNPRLLRTCLVGAGMKDKYTQLERGQAFTFPG
jgi:L-ascorbate 6-phosphate lactonase